MIVLGVDWSFFCVLPLVAFFYAAIGHGGASGYLALMSLYEFSPNVQRPTALLLNLFVAGISFLFFYDKTKFRWNLFLPLAIASVPMAFLGGTITLEIGVYKKILAVVLLVSTLKIMNLIPTNSKKNYTTKENHWFQAVLMGGTIGFLSGLIGIGGGIILSPILLVTGWANIKETAALSALFIWINSLSGLAGQFWIGITIDSIAYLMLGLVSVGGLVGAYFGSRKFSTKALRYLLALVLITASIKLMFV